MATARTSSETEPNDRGAQQIDSLISELETVRARKADDPFCNPVLLLASRLASRIDNKELSIVDIDSLVQTLTADAFRDRAARLANYLGVTDPHTNTRAIADTIRKISNGSFGTFRDLIERCHFGVVFTAHPTFWIPLELALAIVELATGQSGDGAVLTEAARAERISAAHRLVHCPHPDLSIDVEHAWSVQALRHAHEALETIHRIVLRAARARWPDRWATLNPRLIGLSSWVGYDQDGRTDLTWMTIIGKRLVIKRAALERHSNIIERLLAQHEGKFLGVLEPIRTMLAGALKTVDQQIDLLTAAEKDSAQTAAFARSMVAGRRMSLVDPSPLVSLLKVAVHLCSDERTMEELAVMRASICAQGLGLAHTHVRLNSSQLHNAIRRQIGLETAPSDPANRRTYFNAINELLTNVQPVEINFADLLAEGSSAKRMMMTVAQMIKLVDGESPVRFLIAETETGFTLLAALYYSRLFGVEEHIEISPLFETKQAFERGERVLEEALKSPHYRAYLKRLGRITVQFGYSDSGRFLGQMAATFRIERLRLRIANLLKREGLSDLEVILFNTHGESVGRGGHPVSMADRLRYAAPPRNRAEFSTRGIRVREEESFQGGDGYLMFLTPAAALASLRSILEFALNTEPEDSDDPIYAAPAYATEFFATVEQDFSSLVDDSSYATLLDAFGSNLLYRAGSRPAAREAEDWVRPATLVHPSQMRAITNNAILQQLGYLANTLYGVGRAAAKDAQTFAAMRRSSPRFRRAIEMVAAAMNASDPDVLRAYADIFNPSMWLRCCRQSDAPSRKRRAYRLAGLTERLSKQERIVGLIRRLEADYQMLTELCGCADNQKRARLILLHAIRVALIQQIALLAAEIPSFSPLHSLTPDDIIARILALDVDTAVHRLVQIFPRKKNVLASDEDFGEPSNYRAGSAQSYALEHENLFRPLLQLFDIAKRIGSAINYEIGAIG